MDVTVDKDCGALGGLFQTIINDLKNGSPYWEDFLVKAQKLHAQLKATILATTSFLDAFQKIADLAANSKGATKDIGTALTRICLRQKAVEARLKTFTSSIMDCLVSPLQDKMEDWKKTASQLDKDHAKEYKRLRHEIKKRSVDSLRIQKKNRKAGSKCGVGQLQRCLDSVMQDFNEQYTALEDTEKQAVRAAMVEERSRFCLFVACLKPVVDEEMAMMSELGHLQDVMELLIRHTADPFSLPPSSEQVISDIKGSDWNFHTPPGSPCSIGSRKSSMCSISSINSSSSGSTHLSPAHHYNRCRAHGVQPTPLMGVLRLASVSSQDSGFTSQDTLCTQNNLTNQKQSGKQSTPSTNPANYTAIENASTASSSAASTPSSPYHPTQPSSLSTATWPNLSHAENSNTFESSIPCSAVQNILMTDRPHTISTAYERGHQRPPLTVHTFEPPERLVEREVSSRISGGAISQLSSGTLTSPNLSTPSTTPTYDFCDLGMRPPSLPQRNTMPLSPTVPEKPIGKSKSKTSIKNAPPPQPPKIPDFNLPQPDQIIPQPLYANLGEIRQIPTSPATQQREANRRNMIYGTISRKNSHGYKGEDIYSCVDEAGDNVVVPILPASLTMRSGYGSQGTLTMTCSDEALSLQALDECVECNYSSPRCCSEFGQSAEYFPVAGSTGQLRMLSNHNRPMSMAGYPMSLSGDHSQYPMSTMTIGRASGLGMLRRSSSQMQKPPPPIRRTSSITSQHGISVAAVRQGNIAAGYSGTGNVSLPLTRHASLSGNDNRFDSLTPDEQPPDPYTITRHASLTGQSTPIMCGTMPRNQALSHLHHLSELNRTHQHQSQMARASSLQTCSADVYDYVHDHDSSLDKTLTDEQPGSSESSPLSLKQSRSLSLESRVPLMPQSVNVKASFVESLNAKLAKRRESSSSLTECNDSPKEANKSPPVFSPAGTVSAGGDGPSPPLYTQLNSSCNSFTADKKPAKDQGTSLLEQIKQAKEKKELREKQKLVEAEERKQRERLERDQRILEHRQKEAQKWEEKRPAVSPDCNGLQPKTKPPAPTPPLKPQGKVPPPQTLPKPTPVRSNSLKERSVNGTVNGNGGWGNSSTPSTPPSGSSSPKAVRVRQVVQSRISPNPEKCRESLMDQIKKGTILRKSSTGSEGSGSAGGESARERFQ